MIVDRYGLHHSSESAEAVAAFENATRGVAAHLPSTAQALGLALEADAGLIAAHALKGLASIMLGREELKPVARSCFAEASRTRFASGYATASEIALVEALGFACEGKLLSAAARLESRLDASPREFLTAKVAHALRFMAGDAGGMLLATTRILDAWSPADPGYGFLLGFHAFGLEERGEHDAAERIGSRAVALEPEDAWGLHAVSHVHEMQGRTDEGIAWLERSRPVWARCNNFAYHMAWHLALFHLERGDHAAVLSVYDAQVRPVPTDDFRDMSNAVSLLWRLEQDGVAVGDRWDEIRTVALRRQTDMTLTFAALHNLLALVATGEAGAARTLAVAMSCKAERDRDDQGGVMAMVGLDLAAALVGSGDGARGHASLDRLATRLHLIGGSHAQRDVFLRTLAGLAADGGDRPTLDRILAVRRRIKQDDRFAASLDARLTRSRVVRLQRSA